MLNLYEIVSQTHEKDTINFALNNEDVPLA